MVQYPITYSSTAAFLRHPFWYRLGYVLVTTELSFEHYYFGWSNAEAACVIVGLSYNGRDKKSGRALWNRVDMVGHGAMRWAQNGAIIGRNWNILGAAWLRRTVYLRLVTNESSKRAKVGGCQRVRRRELTCTTESGASGHVCGFGAVARRVPWLLL